ncbi:hypothetical protein, partial [Acidithiobacillus thiooxidans]|uniref:hypothetical protein n=1 Tax=Acidithiobacillus thiooxidans TaxID=930 RepID=UPI001C075EE2
MYLMDCSAEIERFLQRLRAPQKRRPCRFSALSTNSTALWTAFATQNQPVHVPACRPQPSLPPGVRLDPASLSGLRAVDFVDNATP